MRSLVGQKNIISEDVVLGLRKAKFARLSEFGYNENWEAYAGVAELADALDSKSSGVHPPCGFNSHLRHHKFVSRHSYLVKKRQAFLRNKGELKPSRALPEEEK